MLSAAGALQCQYNTAGIDVFAGTCSACFLDADTKVTCTCLVGRKSITSTVDTSECGRLTRGSV